MKDYTAILEPGGFYHIYNRSNGKDKLFKSDDNYRYFLDRFKHYISPIADTFCYCLLPNHFHFMIRCKEEDEVEVHFLKNTTNHSSLSGFRTLTGLENTKPDP